MILAHLYVLVDFFNGEGGIRTRGTVTRTHPFQGCSLSHSDTSPITNGKFRWAREECQGRGKQERTLAARPRLRHRSRGLIIRLTPAGRRYILAAIAMNDDNNMLQALAQADHAAEENEVPVGAVIVHDGRLIGKAHNQCRTLKDPTAHAEMIAITQAAEALGAGRLDDCTLYVTLEPCAMCAGAIVLARITRLVYGAADSKAGACHSLYQIPEDTRLNHQVEVIGGVMAEECGWRLTHFFRRQRAAGKK